MTDILTPEVFLKAGRDVAVPIDVALGDIGANIDTARVEQWLRILPNKRYVGRAIWREQTVLLKLFVGPRAGNKAGSELAGIARLTKAGIPAPKLLGSGECAGGKAAWVITEYLADSASLSQIAGLDIEALQASDEGLVYATSTARTIAQLHKAGLLQKDIHPGNFLFQHDHCNVIDAADIQTFTSSAQAVHNLGVFWAQLPERWWPELYLAYQGESELTLEYGTVCAQAWAWQALRAADLAAKSVRDCSLFEVTHTRQRFISVWREEADDLEPLLSDLDGALAGSRLLKDGGSATVGLVTYRGRDLVIKRYNLKSWGHRLKRFWRPTRAWHSWQAGHRLRVLGVNTPRPVAMLEERCGPFRARGYLVVEAIAGVDLFEVSESSDSGVMDKVVKAVSGLMKVLIRHRISHGDFKATNLLWDNDLYMIDLDAVRWHEKQSSWARAHQKDVARLLRNWDQQSQQYQSLSQALENL